MLAFELLSNNENAGLIPSLIVTSKACKASEGTFTLSGNVISIALRLWSFLTLMLSGSNRFITGISPPPAVGKLSNGKPPLPDP
ncbi:hypothetical protein D3C73_946690 [compost metagenome]